MFLPQKYRELTALEYMLIIFQYYNNKSLLLCIYTEKSQSHVRIGHFIQTSINNIAKV